MAPAAAALPSIGLPPTGHSLSQRDGELSPVLSAGSSAGTSEVDATETRGRIHSRPASRALREGNEEQDDEDDARDMSPRRSSDEVDRLTSDARRQLVEQARILQTSLQAIVDRVEAVKSEHEKLEGGNKFLQSYIGELMQTSRITSTGASKSKGMGRSGR